MAADEKDERLWAAWAKLAHARTDVEDRILVGLTKLEV